MKISLLYAVYTQLFGDCFLNQITPFYTYSSKNVKRNVTLDATKINKNFNYKRLENVHLPNTISLKIADHFKVSTIKRNIYLNYGRKIQVRSKSRVFEIPHNVSLNHYSFPIGKIHVNSEKSQIDTHYFNLNANFL